MLGLIHLMRPKQWIKNGFVLAPLIFAGQFLDLTALRDAFTASFLFCLAASSAYIVNDIRDRERDRLHPKKSKTRPLASGVVSLRAAVGLLMGLYGVLITVGLTMPPVLEVILGYLCLNWAYSFWLKHQPVLDIFTVASGFVLRVYAGALALAVPLSSWMFITTFCLALYLAAIKRRQELGQTGVAGRKVLESYSVSLVDRYAEMAATGALIFYSLFVMSAKPQLIVSIPFVLFGLFRYWYVVESLDGGESPTDALIADKPLLVTVCLWIMACGWALWPVS